MLGRNTFEEFRCTTRNVAVFMLMMTGNINSTLVRMRDTALHDVTVDGSRTRRGQTHQ